MDATHPIWQTEAVRAAVRSREFGAIVRAVRQASDLTLAQLAQ